MIQDGVEMHELPLVIRRMEASDISNWEHPFVNVSYKGEEKAKTTTQEDLFKQVLSGCLDLSGVFTLLEVPGDNVTPYSAAFALQRLNQLHGGSPDSFIRKAIFHELCDTATSEIHRLTSDTVIGLVKCYLDSVTFKDEHRNAIIHEVEKRIGDGTFDVSEVCALIQILSESKSGSSELVGNLFTHLAVRYTDVNEENMGDVFSILRNMSPQHRYILKMLDKRLADCWSKLGAEDVSVISKTIMLINYKSSQNMLHNIAKWVFVNVHSANDFQLTNIMSAFNYFDAKEVPVMKAVENWLSTKGDAISLPLTLILMEFCRKSRLHSQIVFDTAARNLVKNYENYDVNDIFYILRPYGQLGYVPPNQTRLFMAIEDILQSRFDEFQPYRLLELLASFTYIRRIPLNYLPKVFNPHFLTQLKDSPHPEETENQLRQLHTAVRLDFPDAAYSIPMMQESNSLEMAFPFAGWYDFHKDVANVLRDVLVIKTDGTGPYIKLVQVKNTPYIVDFLIRVEPERMKEPASKERNVAILTMMPDQLVRNSQNVLGLYAMRRRHLTQLGYTLIEIHHDEYVYRSEGNKRNYMRRRLRSYLSELLKPEKYD